MKIVFEGENLADLASEARRFLDGVAGAPAAGAPAADVSAETPKRGPGRPRKSEAAEGSPIAQPAATPTPIHKPHTFGEAEVVAAAKALLAHKSPAGDTNQDQGAQFLANLLATEFSPAVRVRGDGGLNPAQYEAFVRRVAQLIAPPAAATAANLI